MAELRRTWESAMRLCATRKRKSLAADSRADRGGGLSSANNGPPPESASGASPASSKSPFVVTRGGIVRCWAASNRLRATGGFWCDSFSCFCWPAVLSWANGTSPAPASKSSTLTTTCAKRRLFRSTGALWTGRNTNPAWSLRGGESANSSPLAPHH